MVGGIFMTFVLFPLQILVFIWCVAEIRSQSAKIRIVFGFILLLCSPILYVGHILPPNRENFELLEKLIASGEPRAASSLLRAYEKVTEHPTDPLLTLYRIVGMRFPLCQLIWEAEIKSQTNQESAGPLTQPSGSQADAEPHKPPIVFDENVFVRSEPNHTLASWDAAYTGAEFPYTPLESSANAARGAWSCCYHFG